MPSASPPLTKSPPSYNDEALAEDNPSSSPDTPPHAHFRRESLALAGVRRSKTTTIPAQPRPVRARRPSFTSIFSSSFGSSVPSAPARSQGSQGSGPFFRAPLVEEGVSPTTSVFSGEHTPLWEGRPIPRRRRSSAAPNVRWLGGGNPNTGDEPGVDVRSARDQEMYGHLNGPTKITVGAVYGQPDSRLLTTRLTPMLRT